jgi:hypothetical protein
MAPLEKLLDSITIADVKEDSFYPMRKITAMLFSFFLVYAGAGEALKGCLSHEDHSDHHHFEGHHSDAGISVTHDHSRSPSSPIVHCATMEQRLGPALQVASANLNRFDQITSVHACFLREPASPASRNSLWREALFKRILTFSLPNNLSRHLFLSILRI